MEFSTQHQKRRLNVLPYLWEQQSRLMASIKELKSVLREEVKLKIASLSDEEKRRQSNVVLDKLINLPSFQESKRVSVFLSISSEVNTEPIVKRIFETGKKCYVPRYGKSGMQMVELYNMDDFENLPLTSWKIKQPSFKDKREDALESGGLDFIITPGVAFTKYGDRLGHGGGYYDAFLEKCKDSQKKPPVTVAVAFKEQVFEQIPVTDHDVVIDKVLYDE